MNVPSTTTEAHSSSHSVSKGRISWWRALARLLTPRRTQPLKAWWWLMPKPFDLVTTSLYVGMLIPYYYEVFLGCTCKPMKLFPYPWNPTGVSIYPWNLIIITSAALAALSVERLEYWLYGEQPPRRPAIVLLVVRVIFIEIIATIDNFNYSPFLYLVIPFLAMVYFNYRTSYLLACLTWIVYIIKHTYRDPGWGLKPLQIDHAVLFTLGLIFAITMARIVIKERDSRARTEQLLAELEQSHDQLKAYSQQVDELATTRERNRLARDIHDTLGHYLTVINVQLEKALAYRPREPEVADQAISDAKHMASEALQDVRRSVGALRASEHTFAFGPVMQELVGRVRSEKYHVTLSIEGDEEGFSKQRLHTLYRAAQEGLTNIQKHVTLATQTTHISIHVRFDDRQATLSLRDNGPGFDSGYLADLQPGRDGRYGLQGLRERLELVGGSLHIESQIGEGTHLLAVVPKN